MIAAIIGHDHFLVWSLPPQTAQSLVPGLVPCTENGHGFLLFAAAEFRHWRFHGLPGLGRLRVAGWLVPCQLDHRRIGSAFIHRFIDHALMPLGKTRIRINGTGAGISGEPLVTICMVLHTTHWPGLTGTEADYCPLAAVGAYGQSRNVIGLGRSIRQPCIPHGRTALMLVRRMITVTPTVSRWADARLITK